MAHNIMCSDYRNIYSREVKVNLLLYFTKYNDMKTYGGVEV